MAIHFLFTKFYPAYPLFVTLFKTMRDNGTLTAQTL